MVHRETLDCIDTCQCADEGAAARCRPIIAQHIGDSQLGLLCSCLATGSLCAGPLPAAPLPAPLPVCFRACALPAGTCSKCQFDTASLTLAVYVRLAVCVRALCLPAFVPLVLPIAAPRCETALLVCRLEDLLKTEMGCVARGS